MSSTSAAVLASGTANAAKLFVAALTFTSAYASSAPEPSRTVTLAAQEVPVTEQLPAQAGKVTVNVVADGAADCAKSFVARSVAANPTPDQGVQYGWRLVRWSPAAKDWRTYLVEHDGFAGAAKTVEWRPRISGNPGWYRVELTVEGVKTVKSDRFQVSC
jgi:hypothetical protein